MVPVLWPIYPYQYALRKSSSSRYEIGCKVSVTATSKGGWFAGAMSENGKKTSTKYTETNGSRKSREPEMVFADFGRLQIWMNNADLYRILNHINNTVNA